MPRQLDFKPTDLNGCRLWLRADMGVTFDETNRISQWNDMSGQGNHVSQPTLSQRPAFVTASSGFDARPSVQFIVAQSTSLVRNNTNLLAASSFSMFMVKRRYTDANMIPFASTTSSPGAGFVFADFNTSARYDFGMIGVLDQFSGNVSTQNPEVLSLVYSTTGPLSTLHRNGSDIALSPNNTTMTDPGGTAILLVGKYGNGSQFYNGELAEMIVFNRPLSQVEVALMEQYLGNRYMIGVTP